MSWKAHETPPRAAGSWWGGRAVAPDAQASLAPWRAGVHTCLAWKLGTAEVLPGQRGLWQARQIVILPSLSFSICHLGESPLPQKADDKGRGKIPQAASEKGPILSWFGGRGYRQPLKRSWLPTPCPLPVAPAAGEAPAAHPPASGDRGQAPSNPS